MFLLGYVTIVCAHLSIVLETCPNIPKQHNFPFEKGGLGGFRQRAKVLSRLNPPLAIARRPLFQRGIVLCNKTA
jgi:hypothetical protein